MSMRDGLLDARWREGCWLRGRRATESGLQPRRSSAVPGLRNRRTDPGGADFRAYNAPALRSRRGQEPFDRLAGRLPAQAEGGVVDWQDVFGAEPPEHLPGLLR